MTKNTNTNTNASASGERAKFEEWARGEWPEGSFEGMETKDGWYYHDDVANDFWICWRAAIRASAPVAAATADILAQVWDLGLRADFKGYADLCAAFAAAPAAQEATEQAIKSIVAAFSAYGNAVGQNNNARMTETVVQFDDAIAELRAALQQRPDYKPWYDAVTDACVVAGELPWDDNDPRGTVAKLIAWHEEIALDPAVSKRAAALQQRPAPAQAILLKLCERLEKAKRFKHVATGTSQTHSYLEYEDVSCFVEEARAALAQQAQAAPAPTVEPIYQISTKQGFAWADVAREIYDQYGESYQRRIVYTAPVGQAVAAAPVADPTDEQIIAALHSCGIDTHPSKYGFDAVQVSATSVPSLRAVFQKLRAAHPSAEGGERRPYPKEDGYYRWDAGRGAWVKPAEGGAAEASVTYAHAQSFAADYSEIRADEGVYTLTEHDDWIIHNFLIELFEDAPRAAPAVALPAAPELPPLPADLAYLLEHISSHGAVRAEARRKIEDYAREYGKACASAASRAMPAPDQWQSIATAPHDDLLLLAYEFDRPGDWRIKVGGYWNGAWEVFGASWTPTRWMPLPAPPAGSDRAALADPQPQQKEGEA